MASGAVANRVIQLVVVQKAQTRAQTTSLGRVHIYDWAKRAGERCKYEIALSELVISSGDAAKMLDAIEESLDQVAGALQGTVVAALCLAIRTWRDHDLCAGSPNPLYEVISIVALRVNQTMGGQFTPLGAHSASLQLQKSWSTRQVSQPRILR